MEKHCLIGRKAIWQNLTMENPGEKGSDEPR